MKVLREKKVDYLDAVNGRIILSNMNVRVKEDGSVCGGGR